MYKEGAVNLASDPSPKSEIACQTVSKIPLKQMENATFMAALDVFIFELFLGGIVSSLVFTSSTKKAQETLLKKAQGLQFKHKDQRRRN